MSATYEYIVVGSGPGGAPVAANLAREGYTVLLLEAGGAPTAEDYDYEVPAFHTRASEEKSMSWSFFVRHYADEEQQSQDKKYCREQGGVFYPRAATLGGCTAHNAMIFAYPSNCDWDAIASLTGDTSWRAARMRRYFQRVENCGYRKIWRALYRLFRLNPTRHGFDGWLCTDMTSPKLALHDPALWRLVKWTAFRTLFSWRNPLQHLKGTLNVLFDPNDWRTGRRGAEGIRLTPLSTNEGRRVGTRELLLGAQAECKGKLTIRTDALATRVLFDEDKRATGVEYLPGAHLYRADPCHRADDPGPREQVTATREVILAAGAFNTPQLLQLSGIGPASLLERHGIRVLVDRPGVGANLQDRYEVSVVTKMKREFRMLEGATMRPPRAGEQPDPYFRQWLRDGSGVYTSNGTVLSILKKSRASLPAPDLVMFGLVTNFRGYYPGYSDVVSASHDHFTWAVLKGRSHNTAGRVAIRSADPRDVPDINFHYFDEGTDTHHEDLEAVVDAVEFVRGMTAAYGDLVLREESPGKDVTTRDQIRQFVRDQAWGHHASCTCKIGRPDDPMAVLDSRFRVYGTKGLRVVDASVFPHIPGLFIVAAICTVAEKASAVILEDAASSGKGATHAHA